MDCKLSKELDQHTKEPKRTRLRELKRTKSNTRAQKKSTFNIHLNSQIVTNFRLTRENEIENLVLDRWSNRAKKI